MKDKSAAGCMIIVQGRKFLLLKRNASSTFPLTWCIPGGRIDPGENPLEAALRETEEESSLDMSNFTFSEIIEQPLLDGNPGKFTTFVYFVPDEYDVDDFNVKIDFESLDWGWFTIEEMKYINLHPGMYYVLNKLGIGV